MMERTDGVGAQDETMAQEALHGMGVYAVKTLEQCLTEPGAAPEGEGWECIHSGCSPDGNRWWLWHRFVVNA